MTRQLRKLKKRRGARCFLLKICHVLKLGTAKVISKALERLVEKKEISRVARGMYARLKVEIFGNKTFNALEEAKIAAFNGMEYLRSKGEW